MTTKRRKGRAVPPAAASPPQAPQGAEADPRLSNLAIELGVAGMQTLIEQYGFTEDQARAWLDQMVLRAQSNRQGRA